MTERKRLIKLAVVFVSSNFPKQGVFIIHSRIISCVALFWALSVTKKCFEVSFGCSAYADGVEVGVDADPDVFNGNLAIM